MTAMLDVKKLHVAYGGIKAIKGIDFHVNEGELVTLIGANGAGKSSTLRALSGLIKPASGKVTYNGKDITGVPSHALVGLGIALCPEGRGVFARLNVHENLLMGAYARNDKAQILKEVDEIYEMIPRLKERTLQMAGTLSGGEQQMLAVSRGLMMAPKLLMLDEPSLGLAPQALQRILAALGELAKSGMAVLMVEQKTSALQIADRAYVLKNGVIVHQAPAADLRNDADVFRHYMN